jgi:hypothetical protein
MKTDIAEGFTTEFEAYFDCIAATVEAIRDEDWTAGRTTRATPMYQVCHALRPILRYAHAGQDYSDIREKWKPRPGHPTRQRMLQIIERARPEVAAYVADVAEKTLADRDWSVPPLLKLIYLLRHSVWHLCCLGEELRARGYRVPGYRKTSKRRKTG